MDIEKLKFPIGKFEKPETISESVIIKWIDEIEQFPNRIIKLADDLSIEKLNWSYRLDGWNIKQVVHHCADSHMNSFIRFKLALTEENPIIKPYEEAKWAELVDGIDNDISYSLQLIESLHYKWVLLLRSLNKEQLSKQFIHPATQKVYNLEEVIGLYAWHCNHHLAHIKQALILEGTF